MNYCHFYNKETIIKIEKTLKFAINEYRRE